MLKQLIVLFLLSIAACAQAVSVNDITTATKNLLEQPGNTFTDAALFTACAGATNILLFLREQKFRDDLKNFNKPLSFTGIFLTQFNFAPLIIRGMPSYKFLGSVFLPTLAALRFQQIKVTLYYLTAMAAGYAGLLLKNYITHYVQ